MSRGWYLRMGGRHWIRGCGKSGPRLQPTSMNGLASRNPAFWMISALALTVAMASGCVRRVVQITSAPEGALVWMNDREVGSTPCEIEILHYGTYDVRIEKAGFEPVMTGRSANVPIWDLPGPDLIAELIPADLESRTVWHFDLVVENTDADQVLLRAEVARSKGIFDFLGAKICALFALFLNLVDPPGLSPGELAFGHVTIIGL